MNDDKYIGLDVHRATISAAVLDAAGKLVIEAILETKAETILQFIRGLCGSLHVSTHTTARRKPDKWGTGTCSFAASKSSSDR
jgi:hypothetical protein